LPATQGIQYPSESAGHVESEKNLEETFHFGRTFMTYINRLEKDAFAKAMHQNKGLDASGIEAYEVHGILFLKGTVPRESDIALAEQVAYSFPGVVDVANHLSVRKKTENPLSERASSDNDLKIAALTKLTGIPHIAVKEPEVAVKQGMIKLFGIVDAFWKRAYLGDIMKNEFPDLYVENALTVIPPREGDYLPEKNPVREPEMFHRIRAGSFKRQAR
jgi:osmotically-inducible protein OsmY